MNKFLKRGLSTLLALALSLSGLSISASEDQPNAQQDETASQGETVGTEPTKYQVHLPTLTGLSYGYDVLRLGKNQDPNETVLLYEAEEEVNLTLNGTEGYKILQVKVQPLQEDPILSTYQAPQLTFSMPSKDVWIEPSLEATPPVPESEHLETDPVQSETSLPQSESETTFIQDPILETESQETPEETGDKPQTETPKPLQTETAQTEATQTEATQTEATQTEVTQPGCRRILKHSQAKTGHHKRTRLKQPRMGRRKTPKPRKVKMKHHGNPRLKQLRKRTQNPTKTKRIPMR